MPYWPDLTMSYVYPKGIHIRLIGARPIIGRSKTKGRSMEDM